MLESELGNVAGFTVKAYHVVIAIFVLWALITTMGWGLSEGATVPDDRTGGIALGGTASAGGVGVQQQQFDGANMGSGSNAERQRLASVPRKFAVGDPVSGPDADEYLRWCGVKNMNAYEARGYGAMNNPRGWLLNTAYDGEPSLKLAEGYFIDPNTASMSNMGL